MRSSPIGVGDVFGFLTVVDVFTGSAAGRPKEGAFARVRCTCGVRKMVRAKHLVNGSTRSCGCRRRRRTHCRRGHVYAANAYTWHGERGAEHRCRLCARLNGQERRTLELLPELFAFAAREPPTRSRL